MRTIATIVCIALIPTIAHLYPLPFNNRFYAQFVRQPWIPAETFTLSSGQKIVGYGLSDGAWTEILLNDTRTIHFYPASDVAGRQVCQLGQAQPVQPPLITLSSGGTSVSPRTPPCQDAPAASSPPVLPGKAILPVKARDHDVAYPRTEK